MKTRLLLLSLLLLSAAGASSRTDYDSIVALPDGDFFQYTLQLKDSGNRSYLLSDRTAIGRVLACYDSLLTRRQALGLLTRRQADSLQLETLKLQGDWHYENSDLDARSYAEGERCFLQCLQLYGQHPSWCAVSEDSAVVRVDLAQLYYKWGRYADALTQMKAAYEQYAFQWHNDYLDSPDDYYDVLAGLAMCLARTGQYDEALQRIDEVTANYADTTDHHFAEARRQRAKILMLKSEATHDPALAAEAVASYQAYFYQQRAYATAHLLQMSPRQREEYWLRQRPFFADCYRLEQLAPGLLYDVALFAKCLLLQLTVNPDPASLRYSWQDVQRRLTADSRAVEFVQYERGGRQRMAALVLASTGEPQFVPMPTPDSVMAYSIFGSTMKERVFSADWQKAVAQQNMKDPMFEDAALRQLVWPADLRRALGKATKVYFAPDGFQQQLAIEYIYEDINPKAQLYRLTSTRRLLEARQALRTDSVLLLGGVDFDARQDRQAGDNDERAHDFMSRKGKFEALQSSKEEVESIFAARQAPGDSLLLGDGVTEAVLRGLCGHYPIVSISTHGYFVDSELKQGTDIKPCLSDETLSRSLLALAAYNTNVPDDAFDNSYLDGLFSAREMSQTDMRGVQLFVVCACQTGLGYVTSDGVFGIQRGLKSAGVEAMLVSLWSVSDDASSILMLSLHEHLRAGYGLVEAWCQARSVFTPQARKQAARRPDRHAMERLKSKERETGRNYNLPRYRNPFILIDAL